MFFAYTPVLYPDSDLITESSSYVSQSGSTTRAESRMDGDDTYRSAETVTYSRYYFTTARFSKGRLSSIVSFESYSARTVTYYESHEYYEASDNYSRSGSGSSTWGSVTYYFFEGCLTSSGYTRKNIDGDEIYSSTFNNTVPYLASATTSYTTLLDDGAVGTRIVPTVVQTTTDAGDSLVSFHTDVFAGEINEAFCLHLTSRTGAVCTLLGGSGVFAGEHTLISDRFFETTAYRQEVAGVYDAGLFGTGTNYATSSPGETVVADYYDPDGGASTYEVGTQLVDSKLTSYTSTRPTPSVVETNYGLPGVSGVIDVFNVYAAVGDTTWARLALTTYPDWRPIAQDPGATSIRRLQLVSTVETAKTELPYVLTSSGGTTYTTAFIDPTYTSPTNTWGGTGPTVTTLTANGYTLRYGSTRGEYVTAGSTRSIVQATVLKYPGEEHRALPVIVRRANLGGVRSPQDFYTGRARYEDFNFIQTPTQYGFAERNAVLAPLFSDTEATADTLATVGSGDTPLTQTAFLWTVPEEPLDYPVERSGSFVVGVNDRPAVWDAFVITPVGVFLTASYNDNSESGPVDFTTTYFPAEQQTTQELTGLRTIWEEAYFRSYQTLSVEQLIVTREFALTRADPGMLYWLVATTPRFYNNTAEFF